MAEEEESVEEVPKKKGGLVKKLIIAFVILLVLGGMVIGGIVVYSKILVPSLGLPPIFGAADIAKMGENAKKEDDEKELVGEMFPLPSFIVNLSGSRGERFIKVTIQLEMTEATLAEELSHRLPQIQDHVITVLSSETLEDVTTSEGKFKLKETIMSRVNMLLQGGTIKNIYFTEFVVQ